MDQKQSPASSHESSSTTAPDSRRRFLKTAATALAAGATVAPAGPFLTSANASPVGRAGGKRGLMGRATIARSLRYAAADTHFNTTAALPPQPTNDDDKRYAGEAYYASFTKTLPHDEYGEVAGRAYKALLEAVDTGNPRDFDNIPLDASSILSLANPQGAFRFPFAGLDGFATRIEAPTPFRSATTAAEMGELFWLAVTRDIPFSQYYDARLIEKACEDLDGFSATVGPVDPHGRIVPELIFRGLTPGDQIGPYISQFLWLDVPYGPSTIQQIYPLPTAGVNFMTNQADWLNVLRGGIPSETLTFESSYRYIFNNRSLGEYVHSDVLFQAYFNAMLICFGFGRQALDVGNPYRDTITNQGPFTSLGGPWMIDLLTQAGNLALSGAWYQKWVAHRRLRPEVFAGRMHSHMTNQRTYEINPEVLNCKGVEIAFRNTGSYFLPMAYTEGSPTHPAYPAGHACVAGACATVLKAVFDENFVIPNPVVASHDGTSLNSYGGTLTLGNEVNKLASNIALGRDAAGVHYRSDGTQGIFCGEQQALALLQDYSTALNEDFGGFHLTLFDGTPVQVIGGQINGL